jgi:RimJ/RimL family protein N-acetyltransferase
MNSIEVPQLRGKYVYLTLLQPADLEAIRPLVKNERIWEFTKTLLIDDCFDAHFDAYMAIALDNKALGGQHSFVIRQVADNSIVGMTRLYEIAEKDKRLEIGYTWYIPAVWGKTHNPECKLLLLQYAFEQLQYNRVAFKVAHQNIRSQKAVAKIGGVKEGVLRKYGYRPDGELRDSVVFSILNDEWPAVKEKLGQLITDRENK